MNIDVPTAASAPCFTYALIAVGAMPPNVMKAIAPWLMALPISSPNVYGRKPVFFFIIPYRRDNFKKVPLLYQGRAMNAIGNFSSQKYLGALGNAWKRLETNRPYSGDVWKHAESTADASIRKNEAEFEK